jgi:hypothetical protein
MNIHLITFGDGDPCNKDAATRICLQATELEWFHSVNKYDTEVLSNLDPEWHSRHIGFIKKNVRGYGYWIWKPKIILESLQRLPDNDILIYLDAGCELNKYGFKMFNIYLELTQQFDFLAFHSYEGLFHESFTNTTEEWTKNYTINYLKSKLLVVHGDEPMIEAGILFIKNNNKTREFIENWLSLCLAEDYGLINNDNFGVIESTVFKEHRHDQSIFSWLMHANNFGFTLKNDSYQSMLFNQNFYDIQTPVLAFRNKSGSSVLKNMNPILNPMKAALTFSLPK